MLGSTASHVAFKSRVRYPSDFAHIRRSVMAQGTVHEGRISHRGFASMNTERQRQIASMGGKAVPDEKRSFSQNRRLAAEAGRKGGQSVPGSKRSFSQNRALAAVPRRQGGQTGPHEERSFSPPPEPAAGAGRQGGQRRPRH